MNHEEALQILQKTAARPVFAEAFRHLKAGTELAVILEERTEFAFTVFEGKVIVVERAAQADVEFHVGPEGLRVLSEHPGQSLASFGIAVLEQVAAGEVKIRIRGSWWKILNGGYLQLILAGGPDFLQYLAERGIKGSMRILEIMKSLKK